MQAYSESSFQVVSQLEWMACRFQSDLAWLYTPIRFLVLVVLAYTIDQYTDTDIQTWGSSAHFELVSSSLNVVLRGLGIEIETETTYEAAFGFWAACVGSPPCSIPSPSSSAASYSLAVFANEVKVSVACLSSLARLVFSCNKPDLSTASLKRKKVLFISSMIECNCEPCCFSDEMVVSFL